MYLAVGLLLNFVVSLTCTLALIQLFYYKQRIQLHFHILFFVSLLRLLLVVHTCSAKNRMMNGLRRNNDAMKD